jgi:hypothetical protein
MFVAAVLVDIPAGFGVIKSQGLLKALKACIDRFIFI